MKEVFNNVPKGLVTLSLWICFATISSKVNGQTIVIGSGSIFSSSPGGPVPRNSASDNKVYSKVAYLYTSAELSTAGLSSGAVISSISWFKDDNAATNSPGFVEIWMKNSNAFTVSAPHTWNQLVTGGTLTYNQPTSIAPANGWVTFNFSTPFIYTGGSHRDSGSVRFVFGS